MAMSIGKQQPGDPAAATGVRTTTGRKTVIPIPDLDLGTPVAAPPRVNTFRPLPEYTPGMYTPGSGMFSTSVPGVATRNAIVTPGTQRLASSPDLRPIAPARPEAPPMPSRLLGAPKAPVPSLTEKELKKAIERIQENGVVEWSFLSKYLDGIGVDRLDSSGARLSAQAFADHSVKVRAALASLMSPLPNGRDGLGARLVNEISSTYDKKKTQMTENPPLFISESKTGPHERPNEALNPVTFQKAVPGGAKITHTLLGEIPGVGSSVKIAVDLTRWDTVNKQPVAMEGDVAYDAPPYMRSLDVPEERRTPTEVVLFHELIHTLRAMKGNLLADHLLDEFVTVGLIPSHDAMYTENQYRREQGLPLRRTYGGRSPS